MKRITVMKGMMKRPAKKRTGDAALSYTAWGIKYPWHVSDEPYPKDRQGNCTCGCKYCTKMYEHKATRAAHLR